MLAITRGFFYQILSGEITVAPRVMVLVLDTPCNLVYNLTKYYKYVWNDSGVIRIKYWQGIKHRDLWRCVSYTRNAFSASCTILSNMNISERVSELWSALYKFALNHNEVKFQGQITKQKKREEARDAILARDTPPGLYPQLYKYYRNTLKRMGIMARTSSTHETL